MAKGKYSARAANRMAATDNEVIATLRAEVAQLAAENRRLTADVTDGERQAHSIAMHEAGQLADAEIARLEQELAKLRETHSAHIEALCFDLLDLYHEHGCVSRDSSAESFNMQFAELFGLADRYGEIWDYIKSFKETDPNLNREERRATNSNKKMRRTNAIMRDMVLSGRSFGVNKKKGLRFGRAEGYAMFDGLPR